MNSTRSHTATRPVKPAVAVAAVLMLASPASFAADLPIRAPAAPPAPAPIPYVYNWTGFYIGGNAGGAWQQNRVTDTFSESSFDFNRSGFAGGGQIGYNWQIAPQLVIGVDATFDATDLKGSTSNGLVAASSKADWITTVAARFGVPMNNWLFYGKAGGGWVHDSLSVTDLTGAAEFLNVSTSRTQGGWLAGAGIEYGITPNWTVGVEYNHLGLDSVTTPGLSIFDTVTSSRRFDLVTARLNYKF